ncbi:MAG: hypothetical protein UIL37_04210 [Clostridia bacterium]|nr:hypothetical protein [Clostridia bacterium]
MDFLNKIKSFASNAADTAGQKGRELYASTKVRLEIADKQNSVKTLYKEIGYEAYRAYREQTDVLERITPKFDEIDQLEDSIAVLRKNLQEKKVEEMGVEYMEVDDEDAQDAEITEDDIDPIEPIE